MKRILKITILFVVFFTTAKMVYSQNGIAPADVYVILVQGGGEPSPVPLTASGSADCCYQWSSPDGGEIIGASDQQTISVKPKSPKTTFNVTRACISGTETGTVKVHYSDFEIISISPKNSCYEAGESVDIGDYFIITDPPGFESKVTNVTKFYPRTNLAQTLKTVDIEFNKTAGQSQTKTCSVLVVDDSHGAIDVGLKALVEDLEKKFKKLNDVSNGLQNLLQNVKGGASGFMCAPKGEITPTLTINFMTKKCCNNANTSTILDRLDFGLKVTGTLNVDCDFPTPWSIKIPGIAQFGVFITAGCFASAEVSGIYSFYKPAGLCGNEFKIATNIAGGVYGGVKIGGGSVVGPDDSKELSATTKIIGKLEFSPFEITIPSGEFKWGREVCGTIDVEFAANLWGLANPTYTLNLLSKKCLKF